MYWDPEAEEREKLRRSDPNYEAGKEEEYVPGSIIRASRVRRMRSSNKLQRKSGAVLIRTLLFLILLGAVLFFMADSISLFF